MSHRSYTYRFLPLLNINQVQEKLYLGQWPYIAIFIDSIEFDCSNRACTGQIYMYICYQFLSTEDTYGRFKPVTTQSYAITLSVTCGRPTISSYISISIINKTSHHNIIEIWLMINVRETEWRMENPEKLITLGRQDTRRLKT